MNETQSGNVPQTIDSYGNIVPKPNGLGRWHSPRRYACSHEDCPNEAVALKMSPAHNCCDKHEGNKDEDSQVTLP